MTLSAATQLASHPSPASLCCPSPGAGPVVGLAAEMRRRWLRGERPGVEEYLTSHPELQEQPEAAIALIYEELTLRRECGSEQSEESLFARFPQWRHRLQILLECDRLLGPGEDLPDYPAPGEALGNFRLLVELGHGARGRVFLATQPALADRPVVLKLTPREGCEDLSLARLQHTNIVPLHWVQDYPERRLRALCMPFFSGATLADLLHALVGHPPEQRTGRLLIEALDRVSRPVPAPVSPAGSARQLLVRASWVEAVCWIGAWLADALQHAHERGLVHLDLKPSNVLLTADGQPMLLDFHLARAPVPAGRLPPEELGGSPAYMPPEQQEAMHAVAEARAVRTAVDGRADLYSLGVILHEALGGQAPAGRGTPAPLHRVNPHVSMGLSDVLGRCVAADPRDRYPTAADLAADLRRHLTERPLCGVANRSLAERCRKWRRRHPGAPTLTVLLAAVLGAALSLGAFTVSYLRHQYLEAEYALRQGRLQWRGHGHYAEAVTTLEHGLEVAEGLSSRGSLAEQLRQELGAARDAREAARRAEMAGELHQLADGLRLLYGEEQLTAGTVSGLEAPCRETWQQRGLIREALGTGVDADLLDVAILWADLRVRSAPASESGVVQREALRILDQAEALFGTSAVLEEERQRHRRALGLPVLFAAASDLPAPRTAWEHYALGRSFLSDGNLERAAAELDRAVRLGPSSLWPNYYYGLCAYRRKRYDDAALAFSVCIGAAPGNAKCHYHCALAWTALGRPDRALADYDYALQLDPALAAALLNRGMLHYRAARYDLAVADLQGALRQGADPAMASYDLAIVHLARHDRAAALSNLRQVLVHDPRNETARKLLNNLDSERRGSR